MWRWRGRRIARKLRADVTFQDAERILTREFHAVASPVRLYLGEQQSLAEELDQLSTWHMFLKVLGMLDMRLCAQNERAMLKPWVRMSGAATK